MTQTATNRNKPTTASSFVLGLLLLTTTALAGSSQTRIATNRVIHIDACESHVPTQETCTRITQIDAMGNQLPTYHLYGNLEVIDMAVNDTDDVVIAGSFRGDIHCNGQWQVSAGGLDTFYLLLDETGRMTTFERMGGAYDDRLFAVTYDPFGSLIFQAATASQKANEYIPQRIYLEPQGHIEIQNGLFPITLPPDTVLDDEDEEPVDDPLG